MSLYYGNFSIGNLIGSFLKNIMPSINFRCCKVFCSDSFQIISRSFSAISKVDMQSFYHIPLAIKNSLFLTSDSFW